VLGAAYHRARGNRSDEGGGEVGGEAALRQERGAGNGPLHATIRPMEPRRGGRPSQVSPRQPSNGRPIPKRVRPVAPSAARLSRHRSIERRRGLPPGIQIILAAGIVLLGAVVLFAGVGKVGPILAAAVRGLGGLASTVVVPSESATPLPSGAISDSPTIAAPSQQYTNSSAIEISVRVPGAIAGQSGFTVRLWVSLPNTEAVIATEVPVGATTQLKIPDIALAEGPNSFQASIVGPAGESVLSAPVTWILDTAKPSVKITSPANGVSVSKDTVTIKGKTQASSSVRIANSTNGAAATTTADTTGAFSASVAIAAGKNDLTVTATDPAGNANSASVSVTRGTGQLRVVLTGTAYRFTAAKLPKDVTFTVVVTGGDGRPEAGATVLFTVTVPGLLPIISTPIHTDGSGTARFATTIPPGTMKGTGLASVLVTLSDGVSTGTGRQVLTVQ
jgi:hypothetical protein